jgi:hypothetical protein
VPSNSPYEKLQYFEKTIDDFDERRSLWSPLIGKKKIPENVAFWNVFWDVGVTFLMS